MRKRLCFWKPFGSEHVSESQKLLKFVEKHFYPTFSLFWAKLSEKMSILVRSEILGLLVNTSPADYKYSRSNRQNLPLPIQMQLSKKQKIFCSNFIAFLKFKLNFWHFQKNEPHILNIFKIIDFERHIYLNAWKILFLKTLRQWMY